MSSSARAAASKPANLRAIAAAAAGVRQARMTMLARDANAESPPPPPRNCLERQQIIGKQRATVAGVTQHRAVNYIRAPLNGDRFVDEERQRFDVMQPQAKEKQNAGARNDERPA